MDGQHIQIGVLMTDTDTDININLQGRFSVAGWASGIAWYLLGYEMLQDKDYEWSGIETENREYVRAIMVGDDREFTIPTSDITEIEEEDYCPECGQIGCKAYG